METTTRTIATVYDSDETVLTEFPSELAVADMSGILEVGMPDGGYMTLPLRDIFAALAHA